MRSALYEETLASPRWRQIRAEAVRQAGGRCERCGARKRLDGHHRNGYHMLGQERPEDIQPLCRDCHDDIHRRKRRKVRLMPWGIIFATLCIVDALAHVPHT